ncbi:MAG: rhodanese-like domain-containing protein [Myxococcota bacterium]
MDKHVAAGSPNQAKTKITPEELKQLIDQGQPVAVFDVREPQHFSRSHLRRSRCVAPDKLFEAASEVPPGVLVVVVDRIGETTEELAKDLQTKGLSAVALEKGLLAWEGSLFPTYSDREEARLDA